MEFNLLQCLVFIKLNRKTYQELDVDQLGRDIMNTVYEGRERISRLSFIVKLGVVISLYLLDIFLRLVLKNVEYA